jgi:hypothetical protein
VRLVHAAPIVVQFGATTLSTSPISKLRAADDERRQAKRNNLADRVTVEAKSVADLKVEKAAVEGERRTVEADLGPARYLATLIGADNETVLRWFILIVALLLEQAPGPKSAWARLSGRDFRPSNGTGVRRRPPSPLRGEGRAGLGGRQAHRL